MGNIGEPVQKRENAGKNNKIPNPRTGETHWHTQQDQDDPNKSTCTDPNIRKAQEGCAWKRLKGEDKKNIGCS